MVNHKARPPVAMRAAVDEAAEPDGIERGARAESVNEVQDI